MKQKELTPLKKGTSTFNLVGRAIVNDYTFGLDKNSSKSDWIYNQMRLSVDCGEDGKFTAESMGGYGASRQNKVYVHGRKQNDAGREVDDFDNRFEIDWEDRLDEDNFDVIGDMCFFEVGLEKDTNDKTVSKKFLTQYDMIQYISDNIEDGMIVNIKGNITYSEYEGTPQINREVKSIFLSSATEDKFRASFIQTMLVDIDSVEKPDKETKTISVLPAVVEYTREFNEKQVFGKDKRGNIKDRPGMMLPLRKQFFIRYTDETLDKVKKLLKIMRPKKKGTVNEITVEGRFNKMGETLDTKEVTLDDLDDETREMIEAGYLDEKEILDKIAFSQGGSKKPDMMVITKPHLKITTTGEGENKKTVTSLDKKEGIYTEDDIDTLEVINYFGRLGNEEEDDEEPQEDVSEDTEAEDEVDSWFED